jgi:hypothetical protein
MRKSALLLVLLLGALVATAPGKAKKEAPLSKMFCQAQYVYVQTYEGDTLNRNVSQEDYDAATAVEQRIQRWGRYVLVYQQQQADLVWVVWKERKGGNRLPGQPTGLPPVGGNPRVPDPGTGGPQVGGRGEYPGGPQSGPGGQNPGGIDGPDGVGLGRSGGGAPLGGEIVPPGDLLAVYMPPGEESLSAPIWKHSEKDGLNEPDIPLFRKLADAVDDACSDSGSKRLK